MAKKNSADLKKEADKIKEILATARKKPMNFALLIGKDSPVLEADLRKPAASLRRLAKANGGGTKGATGQMSLNGKIIEFQCDSDDVPKSLGKLAKKYFSDLGLPFRCELILPSGEASDVASTTEGNTETKPVNKERTSEDIISGDAVVGSTDQELPKPEQVSPQDSGPEKPDVEVEKLEKEIHAMLNTLETDLDQILSGLG